MHIWTENSSNELKRQLKLLSYYENCKGLLTGRLKSARTNQIPETNPHLERRAQEMSFCIQQALEFFEAAHVATIATSPLPLYYGILSLSKALIIANSTSEIFLDDARMKYHGLSSRPLNSSQSSGSSSTGDPFLSSFSNVRGGVFRELDLILNQNYTLAESSEMQLLQLITSVPEISAVLKSYLVGCDQHVVKMYADIKHLTINGGSYIQFSVSSPEDEQNLVLHHPALLNEFDKTIMHGFAPCFTSRINATSIDFLYSYQAHVGGQYFVLETPVRINGTTQHQLINQVLIDFVALHILSEQVRYRQDERVFYII